MHIVKMIAMIFLAVYLILTGMSTMSEIALAPMASNILNLLALSSGILILISLGKCCHINGKRN